MLPDEALSTRAIGARFLPPRNVTREPLVDYELGGVALQDASQGLQVKVWKVELVGDDVVLSAEGVAPVVLFTQSDITEIALAFDQNMQPFVAYMLAGRHARFRWFDATVPGFVTTALPAGSYSLRASLDDKRGAAGTLTGRSDIVLTYLREGHLYCRAQRDRYEIEYDLDDGHDTRVIGQFGMSRAWRLQWQLIHVTPFPEPEITAISPSSAIEGSGAFALEVTGENFVPLSRVLWDGSERPTTYVSPTRLIAAIPASDLLIPGGGEVAVTVANPLPGGGESNSATFTVVGTFLRLTEDGDIRITEAGDQRELEH